MFLGQDVTPERYDPLVDQHDVNDIRANMANMRALIRRAAESTPTHEAFIARYCPAVPMAAQ